MTPPFTSRVRAGVIGGPGGCLVSTTILLNLGHHSQKCIDESTKAQSPGVKGGLAGLGRTVGPHGRTQITTARDQALLGRVIQDRFPIFYRYFSTVSFRYRGKDIHDHNALLSQVEGVDGIKTGYTEASG
jgi:D-alanyl-D-alanine carboxypeptidase